MKNDLDFDNGIIGKINTDNSNNNIDVEINNSSQIVEHVDNNKINEKSNLNENSDKIKEYNKKGFKGAIIYILIIILMIVGSFYLLQWFMKKNNIKINKPNNLSGTTTEKLNSICNNVTMDNFLLNYELTDSNLEYINTKYLNNYKYIYYYLSYEGYIFKNSEYLIITYKNNVVCKNSEKATSTLKNITELKNDFNNLNSSELKQYLKYDDRLLRYNNFSSIYDLENMFKRMNLTKKEINNEIAFIEDNYESVVNSDITVVNFSMEMIISALKEAYNE